MSKCIRILQVFAEMNRGGAENMIMNLYRKIDHNIIQFDFVVHTQAHCAFDNEILELGGKIYRVPRYKGINHIKYMQAWHRFFKEHTEYVIVHSHLRSTASLFLPIAKKHDIFTIIHSHSTSDGTTFKSFIKGGFEWPLRYIADYFIACSTNAGLWLFGSKIVNGQNFAVLQNAIDIDRFTFKPEVRSKVRHELNLDNKIVIGHVGRFCAAKNHTFLINIFASFLSNNKNAILILVGDGVLKKKCEDYCKSLGIEHLVLFTGIRDDIDQLMQAMDIIVFPSVYEGYPVTLVEAQASGIPCVISNAITSDVAITENTKSLSLAEGLDNWLAAMQHLLFLPRKDNSNILKEKGYDINMSVTWLTNLYLSKANKRKSEHL